MASPFHGLTEAVTDKLAKLTAGGNGSGGGIGAGSDLIYVRAQEAKDNWGPISAQWLRGVAAQATSNLPAPGPAAA